MAAITRVYTLQKVAQMLEQSEEVIWDLSLPFAPEDGEIWIIDINGAEIQAFTEYGIENLQNIIEDIARHKK